MCCQQALSVSVTIIGSGILIGGRDGGVYLFALATFNAFYFDHYMTIFRGLSQISGDDDESAKSILGQKC